QGVKLIKANHPNLNPLFIFISPPDFSTLKSRLVGRGTETEDSVRKRLKIAKVELEYARMEGSHHHVIVNDDLERAYSLLRDCIFHKEGLETDRVPPVDEEELKF
ncbi:P-loop containing nucleoside triphosphate hydrolase protein, partial [Violaceomyces palustris]